MYLAAIRTERRHHRSTARSGTDGAIAVPGKPAAATAATTTTTAAAAAAQSVACR